MKTLEFDAGNSRLKWRLSEFDQIVDSGFFVNSDDWNEVLPALLEHAGKLKQVSISIVSGDERYQCIRKHVLAMQSVPIYKATPKKACSGVTLAYENVEKLGADRWLAMLAVHAMGEKGVKVVVDCGTAITIDILDQGGFHLGGYITPGISLMKRALAVNADKLILANSGDRNLTPGKTTTDCINHGILGMVVALVDRVVDEYSNSRVVLTGGDAREIETLLSIYKVGRVVLRPDLVIDGLAIAAREEREICVG